MFHARSRSSYTSTRISPVARARTMIARWCTWQSFAEHGCWRTDALACFVLRRLRLPSTPPKDLKHRSLDESGSELSQGQIQVPSVRLIVTFRPFLRAL